MSDPSYVWVAESAKNNFPETGYGLRRIVMDHQGSEPVLIRNDPSQSVAYLGAKK
jgi:hypothetical protein